MILKGAIPIGPDETSVDVEHRLAAIGGRLLVETIDALDRGAAIETPQDDALSTYAARILKTDGVMDWARPAAELHNQVRGLYPWPHAETYLNGVRQVIHETRPYATVADAHATLSIEQQGALDHAASASGELPGTILLAEKGRRVLSARETLAGRPWPVGARLVSSLPSLPPGEL
jgi:methionyl-tRNA formyltransferase